ncbi:MAG: hypothetical protein JJ959_12440 [Nisaea sp.]|uniref:hypothetical protein n=1 Tax=Nisaea sp. TaxID=2024842 RepID=UPI001B1FD25B|nr:hypothetical protein [Nisaea sp.]MBO6561342.1 hypothetical protein [Nisaea sp.]
MKFSQICFAFLLLLPLGGCGLSDLFGSGTEEMKVRSLVRDELDRAEIERGPRRRQYIDDRVAETIKSQDTGAARLTEVETQLGQLQTELSIVTRRIEKRIDLGESAGSDGRAAVPAAGVDVAELDRMRDDIDAALRAVSKLNADMENREAQDSARFERLELRTSRLAWPEGGGARGLHLASYKSHDAALAGWEVMRTQYPDLLSGREPTMVEVETVAGLFVRLMVGVGESKEWLTEVRNRIREQGEYAMIMPVPGRAAGPAADDDGIIVPEAPKKLLPGS